VQPVSRVCQIGQNPRPLDIVGIIDTVGGTMFDIWFNGPGGTLIYCDSSYGIHAAFMYSNGTPGTDRNMRYNFFDKTLNAWAFNQGTDFMLWGVNTFDVRTGFGNLDGNPSTGTAFVSAHRAGSAAAIQPVVAQDQTPGGGSFLYCPGEPTCPGMQWPSMGLTSSGVTHNVLMDGATTTLLNYSNISPWCTWAVPIGVTGGALDAGFPDYGIATSHLSTTVAAIWPDMNANPATQQMRGHLRFSHDDGGNWDDPIDIGFPPAYGGMPQESLTYDINSFHGIFDDKDSFHLVTNVQIWAGGVTWGPSEIWHYDFASGWSLIHQALSDSFPPPGSNCTYAGRPTIGEIGPNEFVCVWEQLDSVSYEPNTGQAMFRVLGARSVNGGLSWGDPVVLRSGGTSTYRYPTISRYSMSDTVHIMYLEDLEAGFAVASPPVGTMTPNPVIHQKFHKEVLPVPNAVAENQIVSRARLALEAVPNPSHGITSLNYALPRTGNASLRIYDNAGRNVRTLVSTKVNAGRHTATWDGRSDDGAFLSAGVYFVTLTTENTKVSRKLTLLQ